MRSRWLEGASLFSLLLTLPFASAQPSDLHTLTPDGERRPALLSLAEDVADPVFALLTALVEGDVYGRLEAADLDSVVASSSEGTVLPYRGLEFLERTAADGGWHATIEIRFASRFQADVPYSILGYHPGRLKADRWIQMLEWDLGRQTFWLRSPDEAQGHRPFVAEDVRLFGLTRGQVELDVAWFLDRLLRASLDDVMVTGFVFLRLEGKPYGLAFGYNRKGKGRTGVFDFGADEVVFPAPPHFLSMGRIMRGRLEALLARLPSRPPSARE